MLIRQALRVQADGGTERQIRACIADLGEAIGNLPPDDPVPPETDHLLGKARELRRSAAFAHDPVVASSLLRQAEAVERAEEAGERARVLSRRLGFLRDELRAQAHALRLGLTAFESGEMADPASLARLVESARDVAGEVDAVVSARSELASLEPSLTTVTGDETEELTRLRRS